MRPQRAPAHSDMLTGQMAGLEPTQHKGPALGVNDSSFGSIQTGNFSNSSSLDLLRLAKQLIACTGLQSAVFSRKSQLNSSIRFSSVVHPNHAL